MIKESAPLKLISVVFAIALHGALAYGFHSQPEISIEEQTGAQEVKLGSSFADMAIGTLNATRPTDATPTVEHVDAAEQVQHPEAKYTAPQPASNSAEIASPKETVSPVSTKSTLAKSLSQPLVPAKPEATMLAALSPQKLTSIAPPPVAQPTEATEATKPPLATESARVLPDTSSPLNSARPKVRPRTLEAPKAQPKPKAQTTKKTPKSQKPAPRGNAKQNNTSGDAAGTKTAKANQKGTDQGTGKSAGNAAVSNYPGKLMTCVHRSAGRPSKRGTAIVSFSVSENGRINSAALSKSSGSKTFDYAAVRAISKAGPCPAPPKGARRTYQIAVQVK